LEIDRVEAGTGAWTQVQVCFQNGVEWGAIGQDVWSAAPACFDFIEHRLTLRLDEGHRLPIQQKRRLGLPVLWDRTGKTPRLMVEAVKPGSPMEMAGCQAGDELVMAGALSGRALTRRSLMVLMTQRQPHVWTVRRGEKLERLAMFGASAAAQGGVERPAQQR
jgi:predicted metalloprotease with PDZ domain